MNPEELKAKALEAKQEYDLFDAEDSSEFDFPSVCVELADALLELIERDWKWKRGHYEQACELIRAREKLEIAAEALSDLIREVEIGTVPVFKGSPNVSYAREALKLIEGK
jgi:hypothetical protein